MPDAKRKLPVLYLEIFCINDVERSGQGDVWCIRDDWPGRDETAHALYEPAVPRCRTCDNWELEEWTPGEHFCYSNDSSAFGPDGFCSKHEPRKLE